MPRAKRVVIAGLGDTGVLVAVQLARRFDVVGIATKPALVSGQELGNRLARPDRWRRNYLVPFDRFRGLDHVRTIHGRIVGVDTDRREVGVEDLAGGQDTVPYDVLVIASGVTNGFWRQSRVEDLDAVEAEVASIAERFAAAESVAVVGGGATGVSASASLARRHPGTAVHLFHSGDEPLPGYHPATRRRIVEELRRVGVRVHPGHRAVLPEGFVGDRPTTEPIEWSTGQQPFQADLVLWAVGSVKPNSEFLPGDMLDDDGFVRVDEHLRVPGYPNVFAVGDVAASDPNRSSARNWGYRVVAHNVRAVLGGRSDRLRRFTAPRNRWGSILGPQDDGMLVFQPNGRAVRVPRWAVQPVLYDLFTHLMLYRGVRR